MCVCFFFLRYCSDVPWFRIVSVLVRWLIEVGPAWTRTSKLRLRRDRCSEAEGLAVMGKLDSQVLGPILWGHHPARVTTMLKYTCCNGFTTLSSNTCLVLHPLNGPGNLSLSDICLYFSRGRTMEVLQVEAWQARIKVLQKESRRPK